MFIYELFFGGNVVVYFFGNGLKKKSTFKFKLILYLTLQFIQAICYMTYSNVPEVTNYPKRIMRVDWPLWQY